MCTPFKGFPPLRRLWSRRRNPNDTNGSEHDSRKSTAPMAATPITPQNGLGLGQNLEEEADQEGSMPMSSLVGIGRFAREEPGVIVTPVDKPGCFAEDARIEEDRDAEEPDEVGVREGKHRDAGETEKDMADTTAEVAKDVTGISEDASSKSVAPVSGGKGGRKGGETASISTAASVAGSSTALSASSQAHTHPRPSPYTARSSFPASLQSPSERRMSPKALFSRQRRHPISLSQPPTSSPICRDHRNDVVISRDSNSSHTPSVTSFGLRSLSSTFMLSRKVSSPGKSKPDSNLATDIDVTVPTTTSTTATASMTTIVEKNNEKDGSSALLANESLDFGLSSHELFNSLEKQISTVFGPHNGPMGPGVLGDKSTTLPLSSSSYIRGLDLEGTDHSCSFVPPSSSSPALGGGKHYHEDYTRQRREEEALHEWKRNYWFVQASEKTTPLEYDRLTIASSQFGIEGSRPGTAVSSFSRRASIK